MSSNPHKKPCRFCHHWFTPDPRVGERQYACSRRECQTQRKRAQEEAWRELNPDYFTARRLQQPEVASSGEQPRAGPTRPPPPPSPCRPLDRLPWDLAQTQFGVQGAGFLAVLGGVLLQYAQTQFKAHLAETTSESVGLPRPGPQTQSAAMASCCAGGDVQAGGATDVGRAAPDG